MVSVLYVYLLKVMVFVVQEEQPKAKARGLRRGTTVSRFAFILRLCLLPHTGCARVTECGGLLGHLSCTEKPQKEV